MVTRRRTRLAGVRLHLDAAALVVALLGCGAGGDGGPDGSVDGGVGDDLAVDFWVTEGGPVRVPLAEISPGAAQEVAHLRVRQDGTVLPVLVLPVQGSDPVVLVQVPDLGHDGHSREIHLFADLAPDDPSPSITEREPPSTRAPPRVERILQRRTIDERGFWAVDCPAVAGQEFPDCWVGPAIHAGQTAQWTFAGYPAAARATRVEVTLLGGAVFEHVLDLAVGAQALGEVRFVGVDTETAGFDLGGLPPDPAGSFPVSLSLRSTEVGDAVHLRSAALVVETEPDFDGTPLVLESVEPVTVDLVVAADGFPQSVVAWDVTEPFAPQEVTLREDAGGLVLPGFAPGRTYVVFDPDRVPAPADLIAFDEAEQTRRLLDDGGDLVVIAPATFQPALAPWLAVREAEGWTPIVRAPREVYQTFSGGRPTPAAISAYLEHGLASWGARAPRALVLVGDATPEVGPAPDFAVPTNYLWLPGKWIPSDLAYALPTWNEPDGPSAPRLVVGRIPARTSEEVAAAVARSLAHGASVADRVLLVSDDDGDFQTNAELARAQLPGGFQAQALHLQDYDAAYPNPVPPPPQWQEPAVIALRADLRQALADGVPLVQYFGHGDVNHVAGEGLLAQRSDLNNLEEMLANGDVPPVFVLHNCLSGYFALPSVPRTIAESMVLLSDPAIGAAAVISPAAYTSNSFTVYLSSRLQAALTSTSSTVGEALVSSAYAFLGDSSCWEVDCKVPMMTFSLLGDPTLPSLRRLTDQP